MPRWMAWVELDALACDAGEIDERIADHDAHVERPGDPRHLSRDPAEADQPERAAAELGAVAKAGPHAGADTPVEARNAPVRAPSRRLPSRRLNRKRDPTELARQRIKMIL